MGLNSLKICLTSHITGKIQMKTILTIFHTTVTSISKLDNTLYCVLRGSEKKKTQTLLVEVLIGTTPIEVHLAIASKI